MSIGLVEYARVLRERWRWLAWGVVVAVGAGVFVLLTAPPQYQSTATVFIRTPGDVSRAIDGGDSYAKHRAGTYAELASSTDLAARVVRDLGLDLDPETLATRTTATNRPGTVLIDMSVAAPTAEEAQRTATALLAEYSDAVHTLETVSGSVVPRAELVVVDPPSLPTRQTLGGVPVLAVLVGAVLAGLVAGATGAVLRSLFDRSIRDPRDAARISGHPVLGSLRDEGNGRVTGVTQVIRRRLISAMGDSDRGVILVTGPAGGASTAATAAALAAAFRAQESAIVLVDLDPSSAELTKLCGGQGDPGITDVLLGHAALPDIERHSAFGSFIGVGTATGIPWQLIDPDAVRTFLPDLRERYAWVLLVCPSVPTSAWLAPTADVVVLVVKHGVTVERELSEASALLPKEAAVVVVERTHEGTAPALSGLGERSGAR